MVKGFRNGVGNAGPGVSGTLVKRVAVAGQGVFGVGILSNGTVDSNEVAYFGTGIRVVVGSSELLDNLVTQCGSGIEINNGCNGNPKLTHNRLVANTIGLRLQLGSCFNGATGCGDGCGVSERNIVAHNSAADLFDESVDKLDVTRNVCFVSLTGSCSGSGTICKVDSDCPSPQTCNVVAGAGPCSQSPILSSGVTFQP